MKKFNEYIGSQFGNPRGIIGEICCIVMNIINRAMYRSVVANIHLSNTSRVLDIGYGNGYVIKMLYKEFKPDIFGIDISEDMKIAATKRNYKAINDKKLTLDIGDCCDLNFEDNFFEAITSVNTIYFWQDTEKGLSEIYRVLKKGGTFYNAVYSKEWLQKTSYTKKGFKLFSKEELVLLGKNTGFSDVTVKEVVNGKSYIVEYKK